eukprot:5430587-Pyramimonas_sp.AAC.1
MAGSCYHVSSEVGDDVGQLRADPGLDLDDFYGLRGDRAAASDVDASGPQLEQVPTAVAAHR